MPILNDLGSWEGPNRGPGGGLGPHFWPVFGPFLDPFLAKSGSILGGKRGDLGPGTAPEWVQKVVKTGFWGSQTPF